MALVLPFSVIQHSLVNAGQWRQGRLGLKDQSGRWSSEGAETECIVREGWSQVLKGTSGMEASPWSLYGYSDKLCRRKTRAWKKMLYESHSYWLVKEPYWSDCYGGQCCTTSSPILRDALLVGHLWHFTKIDQGVWPSNTLTSHTKGKRYRNPNNIISSTETWKIEGLGGGFAKWWWVAK